MIVPFLAAAALAAPPLHTTTDADGLPDRPEVAAPAPIINGQVEDGFPATVGIGSLGFTLCTASVITPRILLTAAHCSADFPVELIVGFGQAYFGTEAAAADHAIGFVDSAVHPDYEPLTDNGAFLGRFDLAVLVLAEDAPVEPVWPLLEPLDTDAAVGQRVWSVGFGLDENGASGVKRSAKLSIDEIDDMFLISESRTNRNESNICSGDSGGPQYVELDDGSLQQWAVHSWGDIGCVFNSGSTRTDIAADWIEEQIEAVHGTTDRCFILQRYGDGVCDADCPAPDLDCLEPPEIHGAGGASAGGDEAASGGCATSPTPAGALPLLLLAAAFRRR